MRNQSNDGHGLDLPPAITIPPICGFTASNISAVLMVSCPMIRDNGISFFVFDSEVYCSDGEVWALAAAAASTPRYSTPGESKVSLFSINKMIDTLVSSSYGAKSLLVSTNRVNRATSVIV